LITNVYYAGATGAYTDAGAQGLRVASFDFPKPAVKTTFVDVPGRNGYIDLSESLTGRPTYEAIEGSVTFIVLRSSGFNLKNFVNAYHGKIMRIYTDEDSTHYYTGRATVTGTTYKYGKLQTFTVSLVADPFLWSTTETTQSLSVKTGATSVFTQTATANMASGYPTVATKNIKLKFQQTTPPSSQGSATYSFAVSDTKLYVLTCTISASVALSNTGYSITTGNGTVYGTQLIKPKSGDTTATVKFYTGTDGYEVTFGNICLIELTEITRDTTAIGVSSPYILSNRACELYVFVNDTATNPIPYTVAASTACYVPDVNVLKDSGSQTGIYVGMGLASSNGTATLNYRRGVLA
jgi:hypothetical protein